MPSEADLLKAIEHDPADDLAWLALADCLEENGEDDRAELVRLREWLRVADVEHPQRHDKERRLAELLIANVRPSVPQRTLSLRDKTKLILALIPPGRFWMGSGEGTSDWPADELARHRVKLTRPFWIGVTPVTKGQWLAVLEPQAAAGPRPSHPAQSVLWAECTKYCRALAKLVEGEFRLPTEAEWEYACRAGTSGGVYLGEGEVKRAAWYTDNSRGHAHPVAKKKPNAWGLYDVLGNVWEWCSDGVGGTAIDDVSDPIGPNKGHRIVKGGAWRSHVDRCRAASRFPEQPRRRTDDQGFRVVMTWA